MKKSYSKPDILFESFTLSTGIAYTCEEEPNTNSDNNCGVRFGKYIVFVSNTDGGCDRSHTITPPYDQYCYHVPTSELNIFAIS